MSILSPGTVSQAKPSLCTTAMETCRTAYNYCYMHAFQVGCVAIGCDSIECRNATSALMSMKEGADVMSCTCDGMTGDRRAKYECNQIEKAMRVCA